MRSHVMMGMMLLGMDVMDVSWRRGFYVIPIVCL